MDEKEFFIYLKKYRSRPTDGSTKTDRSFQNKKIKKTKNLHNFFIFIFYFGCCLNSNAD